MSKNIHNFTVIKSILVNLLLDWPQLRPGRPKNYKMSSKTSFRSELLYFSDQKRGEDTPLILITSKKFFALRNKVSKRA